MSMPVVTEIVSNQGPISGGVAERIIMSGGDAQSLRPYRGKNGKSYIAINSGRVNDKGQRIYVPRPTANASLLRKDEWAHFDSVALKVQRARLRAYADLRASNTYTLDGMSTMVLEHETVTDAGEAQVDFDGIVDSRSDQPLFQLNGLPLAITHSDFHFSARRLLIARRMGNGIDTTMMEQAARRVAERIERTTIGTIAGPSLNAPSQSGYLRTPIVQGYTNYTYRTTKTDITAPTTSGWTPNQTVDDVLDMLDSLNNNNFFGPFMLYHSTAFSKYMDSDYSAAKGDNTLRQRLLALEQIQGVRRLDYLNSGFVLLLVQMTSDVCRAVNGMEMTVVQWDTNGGLGLRFKVMAIQVPQIRATSDGVTGICHGTTS